MNEFLNYMCSRATLNEEGQRKMGKFYQILGSTLEIRLPKIPKDKHEVLLKDYGIFKWLKMDSHIDDEVFNLMKKNFSLEMSDTIPLNSDPLIFYVVVYQPHYKGKTKDLYEVCGTVIPNKSLDLIDFCWLHPYLRGNGIMKNFFVHHLTEISSLALSPPVSKSMKGCWKKTMAYISNDPILIKKARELNIECLLKNISISPEKFNSLSDKEKDIFITMINSFALLEGEECKKVLKDKDKVNGLVDMVKELNHKIEKSPELKIELEDWCKNERGQFEELLKKQKDHYNTTPQASYDHVKKTILS